MTYEELHEQDHELVSGIFHSQGRPSPVGIIFKKYDPEYCFEFEDGKKYTIYRMVADKLKSEKMFSYKEINNE